MLFKTCRPPTACSGASAAKASTPKKLHQGLAGSRAGIPAGAKLIGIGLDSENLEEVTSVADVAMFLDAAGVGGSLTYSFQKPFYASADKNYVADLRNIDPVERWTPSIIFLSIVGIVWLGVGLFVLFKQGSSSPFVLHFAMVCLAAFVFHTYRSIGIGRDFDLAIDLLDNIALAFFAPLFLHFCIRYPVRSDVFSEERWKTYILYVPAAFFRLSWSFCL